MDQTRRIDIHADLCSELHDLYVDKNADYGDSFRKVREEIPNAILVRLSDKLNRLKNLMGCEREYCVKDETIDDTLMDLANYALLELVERKMDENRKAFREFSEGRIKEDVYPDPNVEAMRKHYSDMADTFGGFCKLAQKDIEKIKLESFLSLGRDLGYDISVVEKEDDDEYDSEN